jgi:hypothetical protein
MAMKKEQIKSPIQGKGPMVGIFWVDKKNRRIDLIHADPIKSVEMEPGAEFINGPYAHFAVWELLRAKGDLPKKWVDKEYEYVPRGRVLYDRKRKKFKVYSSKSLAASQWFQERVLKEFDLLVNRTDFISDAHYEHPSLETPFY